MPDALDERRGGHPALDPQLAHLLVAHVMITAPKTLPDDTTRATATAVLANPHVHMVLLTRRGILKGTLTRDDRDDSLTSTAPAMRLATLSGRTVGPDEAIADVHRLMVATGRRRLAVVDADTRLLGMLCLNHSQTSFCTDAGVAARKQERLRTETVRIGS